MNQSPIGFPTGEDVRRLKRKQVFKKKFHEIFVAIIADKKRHVKRFFFRCKFNF